jgi:hypothetical protein
VPQDLAAFKFKDRGHGFIKPLKPLRKFRMPRPSASYCEIIGLAAAARRSAAVAAKIDWHGKGSRTMTGAFKNRVWPP